MKSNVFWTLVSPSFLETNIKNNKRLLIHPTNSPNFLFLWKFPNHSLLHSFHTLTIQAPHLDTSPMATLSPTSFTKNFNSSVDFPITSFQTFAVSPIACSLFHSLFWVLSGFDNLLSFSLQIFGPKLKTEQTHFRLSTSFK